MYVDLGPVSVSVLSLAVVGVGVCVLCLCCCLLSPSYSEANRARHVPFGGKNRGDIEKDEDSI